MREPRMVWCSAVSARYRPATKALRPILPGRVDAGLWQ
jgi:hypothetical protein